VTAAPKSPCRVVVLVSGDGSTLQALLDASSDPAYGVTIAAVGSDRAGVRGLARAEAAGVPTFVVAPGDHTSRADWDEALAKALAEHDPRFVVTAGFMRLLGPAALEAFSVLNTHPALLPAFPGAHAVRDALAYGVQVTGCTVHLVDAGIDTGPVIAQRAVEVREGDDEATLHERIKAVERPLLVDVVGRLARDGWTVSGRTVTVP
jgi:phosphoribosylglycinamide formyltransferase-1